MIRKHVKPADPAATIHDPERGIPLPPEGLPVAWTAHWALLERRGEVEASALEAPPPEAPPPPGEPEVPPKTPRRRAA